MEREVWAKAQEIFHQVVELPLDRQQAVLEELCGTDAPLRVHLGEMLEEDRRQNSMLDGDVASLAGVYLNGGEEDGHWRHAEQIGPYRIERMLGEGGMGVVYLAERTDIGGKVAIKLLRDAWVSPARRRRFALEQRTLAKLNHPAIARLYDADALKDGTPWFVMEYVDGLSLTEYWSMHRGSVEECLVLFREVCEAVLYAHGRAIIHRDLKPSNVLVTVEKKVKLLDFGIAKNLDEATNKQDATITGLRPMTPAYAAPEQQSGGAIGVFTDVYALGVLLYELLTGVLPFDETVEDHAEPRRPSSIVKQDRFSVTITRSQWADLNSLVLTAMRTEPEQRYASVEAMMRDVNAFLEKRPLEARADGGMYRLRKFIARHRVPLAYGTVTGLLLVGLIGFFTYRLRESRDEALKEAARTERIQQFTTNLFRGNEPSVGPADSLLVKTLLDRGRIEANSLSGDPGMQADMRQTLGNIYRGLGDLNQADVLLSASLKQRRTEQKLEPRKYAQNLIELGLVRMDEAKFGEAEQLVREGIDVSRGISSSAEEGARPVMANAMVALGSVLEAKGSYPDAAEVLSKALILQPRTESPNIDTAMNLRELANVHFYQGHYTVAESLNQQVLTMHRALYGEKHPEVAEDLNNLGAIQLELGNLNRAEAQYRQSLAITESWYGPQNPKVAEDLTSLGRTLIREKKYQDAKPVLERALNIQQTIHGHDHPTVASALNELGNMESVEEAYDQAEAHFREALEVWRKVYGNAHQFIGVGLSNLGSVYMGQKDYARAEEMYRQALKVFVDTVHEDHTNTGIAHLKLGRALLRQKRYADAETETLRGYQTLVKLVAPTNGFLKAGKLDLTQIYTGLNRKEDADRFRE